MPQVNSCVGVVFYELSVVDAGEQESELEGQAHPGRVVLFREGQHVRCGCARKVELFVDTADEVLFAVLLASPASRHRPKLHVMLLLL